MELAASIVDETIDFLGEGPDWDSRCGRLRWVDIDRGVVIEAEIAEASVVGRRVAYRAAGPVGAVASAEDGGLLIAVERDLVHLGPDGTELARFPLLPAKVESRLNDGACDPAGRYVVGSLALDGRRRGECLVRLEPDGRVTTIDDDLTISNGLGWSLDHGTMYSVDSAPGVVWARDYDPEGQAVGPRRLLFDVTDGTPDGLAVDADGNLWIAIWGSAEVRCYTPQGRIASVVTTTATYPTAAAFGGAALEHLFITSAGKSVDGESPHPDGGKLFVARPGVRGCPTPAWKPAESVE